MDAVRYSFLLVNYNMGKLVSLCTDRIAVEMGQENYEIVVADNSTDPQFRLGPDSFAADPRIRLVFLDHNRGLVDAVNRITHLARGEYVFIMHPDVEFVPGCADTLRRFLESTPHAGVASPNISSPDGTAPKCRSEERRVG